MNWLGKILCWLNFHQMAWQCVWHGPGYWVCERCDYRPPRGSMGGNTGFF